MTDWIDIGALDDFADRAMKAVTVNGRELVVARVGDDLYAGDERCPHLRGHLSRGTLEGTIVRCPLHGSRFDLVDGSVVGWTSWSGLTLRIAKLVKPPRPLKTYPVRSEGGRVFISSPATHPAP